MLNGTKPLHKQPVQLPKTMVDLVKDGVVAVEVEEVLLIGLDQLKVVRDLESHVNVSVIFSCLEYIYFILCL